MIMECEEMHPSALHAPNPALLLFRGLAVFSLRRAWSPATATSQSGNMGAVSENRGPFGGSVSGDSNLLGARNRLAMEDVGEMRPNPPNPHIE